MVAINVLIPNIRPSLEDLKVTLYNTIDKMMSRGMHPNAPITASMSPKKGNIAARVVAMAMDNDQKTNLGRTFTNRKRAVSYKRANTLVIKRTQVGKRGFPSTIKLTRTVAWALLPNSQYPDTATLKKVVITTA